tara:strand:- start:293 stop:712 length:420 start_codon:yes stop_codon:yes gene_type:complete
MKTKTAIEQKAKIVNRLDEVQRAINHWTDKKNQANYYLEERLKERAELEEKFQALKGAALFENNEKIDPSECDTYDIIEHVEDIKGTKDVEVYRCKATQWHYLYFHGEIEPFYCCIGRDDGTFRTLEDLVNWARPRYFE